MNRIAYLICLFVISSSLSAAAPKKKRPTPKFQPNPKRLNPAPGVVVPSAVKAELSAGVASLGKEIARLRNSLAKRPELLRLLPDVQIFHNAVRYVLADDIFTSANQFKSARTLLELGLTRARQLAADQAPWNTATGPVVRGYISKIDGSVQPYGILVPDSYRPGGKPMRLDFWLHGRGDTLNEIAFLDGQLKGRSQFKPDSAFVLEPYGRFMNAFKFAGEIDVFEALEHAATCYPIDRERIAMRGFSMGGAGAWHLGAHHPDAFASVNPGAGFVDVKNYQKLTDKLDTIPWYEQRLWTMYDPLACPINLINSTLVAYSGEDDAQKAAADLMEAALERDGVKMTHIIGPKTGHRYEPGAKVIVAKLVDEATNRGIKHQPAKVTLVTHTLKWNKAHWVTIDRLKEHWKEARIDAERTGRGVNITTRNIAALSLDLPNGTPVRIDGKEVKSGARMPYSFTRLDENWIGTELTSPCSSLNKRHNLQGPIDDAFMDSFIMVRPTGKPMSSTNGKWVLSELSDAIFHWRRFFRGKARVKNDSALSDADIKNNNLILWGDPSSNEILARIADRLPIRWTAKGIQVGDKFYDASKHAPVFIFPNPLNPSRYVVINSGFTFPQFAATTNSQQTPKLPDWAIIDLSVPMGERMHGKGVVDANFFDEHWKLK